MMITIEDPETDRIVRELAALTGEDVIQALRKAAEERLYQERLDRGTDETLVEDLDAIARHFMSLPVLDDRSPDEILGYGEDGLPT